MPIKVSCSCGHAFKAPSKYAGKKVKCPKCKEPLVVPAAVATKGDASTEGAAKISRSKKIAVKCKCGKKFAAKAEYAGKKVKCPECGAPVLIKGSKSKQLKTTSGSAGKLAVNKPKSNVESMGNLFDEVGFNPEDGSAAKKCPQCRAPMRDEAIICIDCGYNESTGKVMQTYRPVTQEDREKNLEKEDRPVAGAKGSGKKSSSSLVIAVAALVLLAAAGGAWYFLMGPGASTG